MSSLPVPERALSKNSKKSYMQMSKCQSITLGVNVTLIIVLLALCAYVQYAPIAVLEPNSAPTEDNRNNFISALYDCAHSELRFNIRPHGDYWLLENYVIGSDVRRVGCGAAVTLVTYGIGVNSFGALLELVRSWQAPVSIAIFAPGTDFAPTLAAIHYVRECSPEAELIRRYVSFHIYFPYDHTPDAVPNTEEEVLQYRANCNAKLLAYVERETYAHIHQLNYSANLAKNIATEAANTLLVLIADVNFVSSAGASAALFKMLQEHLCPKKTCQKSSTNGQFNFIFSLPIFKLNSVIPMPKNREALDRLLKNGIATLVKPNTPLFISHKFIPRHDERILWAPNVWQTKPQFYAICLLMLEMVPLSDAFICVNSDSPSYGLIVDKNMSASQAAVITTIRREYVFLYGDDAKEHCKFFQ